MEYGFILSGFRRFRGSREFREVRFSTLNLELNP
jgi:hypothetical protein